MRRLMRAARAVGAGRLDVLRAGELVRRARPADAHVQPHDAAARRIAGARSTNYQRTLEDKVAQRTKELEIATAHAYKLAQHDILTGLPNRSLLNQRLKQILAQAQRDSTQVACLFLDFDHFKRINDTLGHDAGDQLLQAIAQRLTSAVRETDTVARLGGDEFVVMLPGLDPAHATFEMMTVLARVRESFLAPFRLADQTPTLTCSIGVSMYPLDAQRPGDADQAGRHGDVRRQGSRPQRLPLLHRRHERARAAAAAARDRHAPRPDGRRVLPRLPAADRDAQRAAPAGVEALLRWRDPGARRHRAGRVHPDRRGIRDDPGARRARAARRVPPGHAVAPPGHAAAPVGQPVGAAAAARQLAVDRRGRARASAACRRATSTSRSPRA